MCIDEPHSLLVVRLVGGVLQKFLLTYDIARGMCPALISLSIIALLLLLMLHLVFGVLGVNQGLSSVSLAHSALRTPTIDHC